MPNLCYEFPAGSFLYPVSDLAPAERDTLVNGTILRHLFDDITEEFVENVLIDLPGNLDASGSVTFVAKGYSVTAAASKNIKWRFGHSAVTSPATVDKAFTNVDSADIAVNAAQDVLDRATWTETIANLLWVASQQVRFQISRIAPGSNNLVGDYGFSGSSIIIPVS